jgi:hypothetical protein
MPIYDVVKFKFAPLGYRSPMRLGLKARHIPGRLTTGSFILNSGLNKLSADDQMATGVHGMAT